MSNRFKKLTALSLGTIIISNSFIPLTVNAIGDENGNISDCVIAAKNEIIFTERTAEIGGSVAASNVTVNSYGFHGREEKITIDGFCNSDNNPEHIQTSEPSDDKKYNILDIEDLLSSIEYAERYSATTDNSSYCVENTSLSVNDNIYADGAITFDNISFTGSGYVTSSGDMKLYMNTDTDLSDYCSFYSENGNIFVSGSELTINGMIYAPNGNVYFDVKDLTLNGCVYADNIYFSGTNLTVRRNERAQAGAIEQLSVDAGEPKTAYIGETVALQGTSNYENTSYNWFSNTEGVEINNAGSANAEVSFSAEGRYTISLTGSYNGMTEEDSVVITVLSSVKKTYTTDEDFAEGTFTDTYAENGSLKLSKDNSPVNPFTKEYEIGNNTGIKVKQTVSKDRLSAPSDSVDIDYTFEIPERVNDSEGDSQITGTDFVFVYDNSPSMKKADSSVRSAVSGLIQKIEMCDRIAVCNIDQISSDTITADLNKDLYSTAKKDKVFTYAFIEDSVSNENSFNKMKTDINLVLGGRLDESGGNAAYGISNALLLFDRLYGENYPSDRKHVIIYFGDIEKTGYSKESEYISRIDTLSQTLAEKNVIFNVVAYQSTDQITKKAFYKCIQDMVINTHGVFMYSEKNSASSSVTEDILKVGEMNIATDIKKIQLETNVQNYDTLVIDSITPKPVSIKKNQNGQALIRWELDVDENTDSVGIHIPIKSDCLSDHGMETILSNTTAEYSDSKGMLHSSELKPVVLAKNNVKDGGVWKAVFDSGFEDYNWCDINWKAQYLNDSDVAVYVSAGNSKDNFTQRKKADCVDVLDGIKGRYICVEAEMTASTDKLSPEIEEITVTGGKHVDFSKETESIASDIYGTEYSRLDSLLDLYAETSSNEKIDATASVWGTEDDSVSIINSDNVHAALKISEPGKHIISYHSKTVTGKTNDSTFTVNVTDDDIRTGETLSKYNYDVIITPSKSTTKGYSEQFQISVRKNEQNRNLPDFAWVAVSYNSLIFPLDSNMKNVGTYYRIPTNSSGILYVTVYDWNGNPIPWYTEMVDGEVKEFYYQNQITDSVNSINYQFLNYYINAELPEKILLNSNAYAYVDSNIQVNAQIDESDAEINNELYGETYVKKIKLLSDAIGKKTLSLAEVLHYNNKTGLGTGTEKSFTYEVIASDDTAPVSSIVFDNSDDSTGHNVYAHELDNSVEITVSGKDDVEIQSRKLYIDGVLITSSEASEEYPHRFVDRYSIDINSLTDGKHMVISEVRDTSGNVGKAESSFVIGEDDITKPTITINYSGLIADNVKKYYITSKPQISVIATDNNMVEKLTATINGKEYEIEKNNLIFDTTLPEGVYEIVATAVDSFGNTNSIRDTFEVIAEPDKTKPIITKADISPSIVSAGEKVTITVEAEDDRKLESITVQTLSGEAVSLTKGTGEYIIKEAEEPVFVVTATDDSGNKSEMQICCMLSSPLTQEQEKEYLAAKDETAPSDSIKLVADELKTPAAVYGFVKNSIKQEYYSFSRKGAAAALDQFGGNDIDTASLLISMLRYLGYPARYVNGKVTYTNEEILSMTGMTDLRSAIETFTFRNKNYTRYADRIVIDRTWTEVYVPASMCGIDKDANIWVALDGAYKSTEVTKIDTEDGKHLFLKTNVQKDYTVLPIEPEFNIFAVSSRKASITDEQADTIKFSLDGKKLAEIKTSELAEKSVVLEYRPANSNDYSKYYGCEGMLWNMDLTNYRVVPTLLVDGEIAGTGKKISLVDFNMSIFNPLSISYSPKSQKLSITGKSFFGDEVSSQLSPSGVYAIGIDLYNISGNEILETYTDSLNRVFLTDAKANSSQEDFCGFYTANQTGAVMAYLSKMYFSQLDVAESFLWEQGNYHLNKEIAVGIFGYMDSGIKSHLRIAGANSSIVNELDGNGTVFTDIIRNSVMIRYNDPHFESDSQAKRQRFNDFHRLMNIASYYEGQIWEDYFDDPGTGVSTVSALNKAKDEGIDIIFINSSTGSIDDIDFTGLDSSAAALVAGDINRYVSDGYSVMIHQKPVELGGWKGFGYYVFDPENTERTTYARINGSRNGGTSGYDVESQDTDDNWNWRGFVKDAKDTIKDGKERYENFCEDPAGALGDLIIDAKLNSMDKMIDAFEDNAKSKYSSESNEGFAMSMGVGTARMMAASIKLYFKMLTMSEFNVSSLKDALNFNKDITEAYNEYVEELDEQSKIMTNEIDNFCNW